MTEPHDASATAERALDPAADGRRRAPAAVAGRMFWRQIRKSPLAIAGGVLLVLFYAARDLRAVRRAVLRRRRWTASATSIRRTPLHWFDAQGRFRCGRSCARRGSPIPAAFRYEEVAATERPAAVLRARRAATAARHHPERPAPVRRRRPGARLPARHRLVRPRQFSRAALRRADLADRRPRRHR